MPNLLRKETRQRLEASQKALFEALSITQRPKIAGQSGTLSAGAIEIGLIGVPAELALAACLFEVLGDTGIRRSEGGFYLTATEALSKFIGLLNKAVPKTFKFKKGVKDENHFADLVALSKKFKILFTLRATGLHGGSPVSEQVILHAANGVIAFLNALGKSSNWSPYIKSLPVMAEPLVTRELIISDLLNATKGADKSSAAQNILSAFLVLPNLPENEPDWISAIDRVAIAPNKSDLKLLLSTLAEAKVGNLKKVGKGVKSLGVHIVGKDEVGIPVYPGNIKTKFTKPYDIWGAAVGTENSSLSNSVLHLPHISQIYHFSAVGLGQIGFPDGELEAGLTAHTIWPFLAGSLSYQGTEGPCFFLLQKLNPSELGQLGSLLKKGGELNGKLRANIAGYWDAIESVVNLTTCPSNNQLILGFLKESSLREKMKESLPERLRRIKDDCGLKEMKGVDLIQAVFENDDSVNKCLKILLEEKNNLSKTRSRLATALVDASTDREDLLGLVSLLADKDFIQAHTNCRKAIRAIDFSLYGPSFDI